MEFKSRFLWPQSEAEQITKEMFILDGMKYMKSINHPALFRSNLHKNNV